MELECTKNNITILTKHSIDSGITDVQSKLPLIDILNAEARIILFAGYSTEFRTIYSKAKSYGMTGPGYAWIGSDGVSRARIVDTDTDYAGIILFSPSERYESNITTQFETDYRFYRVNPELCGNPVSSSAERVNLANMLNGDYYPIRPFVYFAASCIDNFVYGFDKFLKANSSRTIQNLVAGKVF